MHCLIKLALFKIFLNRLRIECAICVDLVLVRIQTCFGIYIIEKYDLEKYKYDLEK